MTPVRTYFSQSSRSRGLALSPRSSAPITGYSSGLLAILEAACVPQPRTTPSQPNSELRQPLSSRVTAIADFSTRMVAVIR